MGIQSAFLLNAIRYLPNAEAERYLRAVLESLPDHRLSRAIQVAQEIQATRSKSTKVAHVPSGGWL